MTNIVQGNNKYCVPAVISVIAGISTDSAASIINEIRGRRADYPVTGVYENETREALRRLGFNVKPMFVLERLGSLFSLLSTRPLSDGLYIIGLPGHAVLINVEGGKKQFLDNHTGKPIPASSAARLMQRVTSVSKVEKKVANEKI